MFAIAARRMGYRVHAFSTDQRQPHRAGRRREVIAAYDDLDAARGFAADVDVVTFEFENIPAEDAGRRSRTRPVIPAGKCCTSAGTGCARRHSSSGHGFPVAPVSRRRERARRTRGAGLADLGTPAILKTAGLRLRRQRAAQDRRSRGPGRSAGRNSAGRSACWKPSSRSHRDLGHRGPARDRRRVCAAWPACENDHAPPHPRRDHRAADLCPKSTREALELGRRHRRTGSTSSACSPSKCSLLRDGIVCSSTNWRRGRTTPATSPSTPA